MKKLSLLFAVLFISIQGFSQFEKFVDASQLEILPIDSETNKIDFQGIVKIDSLSQKEIFKRASLWLYSFADAKMIKYAGSDSTTGKLQGIGMFPGSTGKGITKVDFVVSFNINITVKEGRYRYELTNFTAKTDMSPVFDMTEMYFKPKNKKSDGSFVKWVGDYIHATSAAGQIFSKTLIEQIEIFALKPPKSKDDF